MTSIFYIAWRYLTFNKVRTATLIACVTLIAVVPLALEVLELASNGLSARNRLSVAGENETGFLETLFANAEMGVTPAEKKLALYEGRWNGSVDPLFSEAIY